jgi:hypothetical protein
VSAQDALRLAAAGFAVFPLRPASKLPATTHGFQDASRDPVMVRAMFSAVGDRANVGVATGESGLVVVDLDGEAGVESWRRLQDEHARVETLTSKTPRGWHLWFKAPADVEVRNSASRVGRNIDVRAQGGYVVAPPSRVDGTADKPGGCYRWARSSVTRPTELPDWLLPLVLPPIPNLPTGSPGTTCQISDRYVEAAVRGEVTRVTAAVVGTRNQSLRAAAFALGRLCGAGVLEHGIAEQQLRQAGEAAGLGAVETGRTVARGLRDGAREPRQIQRRSVAA